MIVSIFAYVAMIPVRSVTIRLSYNTLQQCRVGLNQDHLHQLLYKDITTLQ